MLLFATNILIAQNTNVLLEPISIRLNKIRIDSALNLIEKKIPYYFSYDAKLIKNKDEINEHFTDVPLSLILDSLLQDPYLEYRIIEKQIVIYKEAISGDAITKPLNDSTKIKKIYKGVVIANDDKKPLPYASLRIKNSGYGIISNLDGRFALKLSNKYLYDTLIVSYMGYNPQIIPIKNLKNENRIVLNIQSISLQEVLIRWHNPRNLLEQAINEIKNNYPDQACHLRSFYRESLLRDKKYMLYIESLVDIYKGRYKPTLFNDKARLLKLRKFSDIKSSDTLLFKLQGGINACILLDVVKNSFDFLDYYKLNNYEFEYKGIQLIEMEKAYCISFKPVKYSPSPDFEGYIYIDTKTYAIVKVDFAYTKESIKYAKKNLVIKKKRGVKIFPKYIKYSISYKAVDGKYYIHHILGEMLYKAKLKRKFIASKYKINFEMITTDINTSNLVRLKRSEVFKENQILTDFEPTTYQKGDKYWKYSNNIVPESDLLKALKSLKVEELKIGNRK